MTKTQVYFAESDLQALHKLSIARKKSVAALIRDAVKRTYLEPLDGPVAVFRGQAKRTSTDHDAIYDDP